MREHDRFIAAVVRRTRLQAALDGAGPAGVVGVGLGLAGLGLVHLGVGPGQLAVVLVGLPVATAAAGAVAGALRRPDRLIVAARADHRLRLHDRVASAVALDDRPRAPRDPEMADWVARSADEAARGMQAGQALPLGVPRSTMLAGGGTVLIAALALLLPPGARPTDATSRDDLVVRADDAADEARGVAQQDALEAIRVAREAAADALAADDDDALERIAEQLREGTEDGPSAEDSDAVGRLASLAESLDDRAQAAREEMERLSEAFDALRGPDVPPRAREIADAIARGDLDAAAEALDRMERAAATASDEPASPAASASELEHDDVARALDSLARAAEDAAREEAQRPDSTDAPDAARGEASTTEADRGEPSSSPGAEDAPAPTERRGESASGERDGGGADDTSAPRDEATGERRSGDDRTPGPEEPRARRPAGERAEPTNDEDGAGAERPDAARRLAESLRRAADRARTAPNDPAGEPEPAPGDAPPPSAERTERPGSEADPSAEPTPSEAPAPADALRRLAERLRRADGAEQAADRLREAARRIADPEAPRTPGAFEAPRSGEGSRTGTDGPPSREDGAIAPDAPRFDPLDLAGADEEAQRVLAEWLADERGAAPAESGGTAPSARSRGARRAERAIEDGTVPSRYHELLRRYFRPRSGPEPRP